MQTFFNPTTPFLDSEARPMVGARVSFLDLDSSASLIAITDASGVPLPNPLFTGSDGRLRLQNGVPAVPCVADGLSYKVTVEMRTGVEPVYIGGILQNPGELYETPYIVFVVTAAGGGSGGRSGILGSVADVRVAPKTLGALTCSGYYEAGDCPSRVFTWVDSETPLADNGVNVLRNPEDNSGYWLMADPDSGTWDVRIAGLSPENGANVNSVRLIALLNIISQSENPTTRTSRIFFPRGFYALSSGFTSYSEVVFGLGAKLSLVGTNAKTLKFVGGIEAFGSETVTEKAFISVPTGGGMLNVECGQGVFRTSWIAAGVGLSRLAVNDTLVVDSDDRDVPHVGARKVIFETDVTHDVDLRGCEIVSDGHIGGGSFKNCVLRGSMFREGAYTVIVDNDCIIHARDFHGRTPLWCAMRSQQSDPIVDAEMETLDANCAISLDGIWFKNVLFENYQHSSSVSVGFENCKGTITLQALGNCAITSEDSELVVSLTGTGEVGVGYQPSLIIHDGSISLMNSGTTFLSVLRATCTDLLGNDVLVNGDLSLDNVRISAPITVRGILVMIRCILNANLLHYTVSQTATLKIENCTLNAFYTLRPSITNTTVHGVWAHNYSSVDSPIIIDRTYIDPVDSHHDYVYASNSGGFLPYETKPSVHSFTIHHSVFGGSESPSTTPHVLTQYVLGGSDGDNHGTPEGFMFPWYTQPLFDQIRMFRIGTDRFAVNAKLTSWDRQLSRPGSSGEYKYNRYHDATLAAIYINGFTWGVMPYWNDPADMSNPLENFSANPDFFEGSLCFSFNNMPAFTDYSLSMAIRYECLDKHE